MHLHWHQRARSSRHRNPAPSPSRRPLWFASALAAAAVLAPVAALAEPAAGSGVIFVPPTPAPGTPLAGMQHLRAEAVTQGSIKSMRLTVRSADPSLPAFAKQNERTALSGQHQAIDLDWETATVGHNGAYRAEAIVETCGASCGNVGVAQDLLVANPPAVVRGVKAEYRKGIPVVTWQRNLEPDLLGYRVFRFAGGAPEDVGHVNATALPFLVDSAAPHGVGISYSVIAVRKSPTVAGEAVCGAFGDRCTISAPSPPTALIVVPEVKLPDGSTPSLPPDSGGAPQTPPQEPAPQQPGRTVTVVDPAPPPADVAGPPPVAPAPAVVTSVPPADTGTKAGTNGSRIVRTPPLDATGGAAAGSSETPPAPAPAEAAPEGTAATSQLEVVGPPAEETTQAFDHLEAAERDQTAAVVTVLLLGAGIFGAYKAKHLLRPGR